MLIVALVVLGVFSGFLAGLLGIGGGMVLVPFLVMILDARGFDPGVVIKVAIATSLAVIVFTSISSVRAHHKRGAVRWDVVARLAPGLVLGTLIGAQIVGALPARLIAAFFAAFIGWTAWGMLRPKKPLSPGVAQRELPGTPGLMTAGGVIGVLSAFLGAGGGFLTIPYLSSCNVRIQNAIATSAACGFPIALSATVGYVIAGWRLHLPDHTVGYVFLPALAVLAPASMLIAPLGARAAHALSVDRMRMVFALVLVALALYMLARALGYA